MRDTAVSPDGRTIYIATDPEGLVERLGGGFTSRMQNPGAILAFTYEREGKPGEAVEPRPAQVSDATQGAPSGLGSNAGGEPVRFTAQQAAAGKTAYNASCAVCHGSTMTNGTFGTPLAGDYFRKTWAGKNVRAFFDKSKTMPPAAPGSLPDGTYVNIMAYIFETNGLKAGDSKLPANPAQLEGLTIR
ncbi:MAG: c-type cytochrome [Bryobacterales bacterium]|nr:c-type cytochrome [Bryobacterales bacterium]